MIRRLIILLLIVGCYPVSHMMVGDARELGGSFMLLHLNVQKIRNLLKENKSESN